MKDIIQHTSIVNDAILPITGSCRHFCSCLYSHALRTLSDLVRAVPTVFIAVQKYSTVSPSVKLSIAIVSIRLVVTLVLVSVIPSVTGVSTEFTTRLHMRVVMVFLGEKQVTL